MRVDKEVCFCCYCFRFFCLNVFGRMIDPFVFAFCVCISCAQVVLGLKHFFVQFVGVVPEDSRC